MKRLILLLLLQTACACAATSVPEPLSTEDLRFLRFEYAECFTLEDVEELRGYFLASFADEEIPGRDRQFTAWWESQIERVFGPKPEPRGRCEAHDRPLTVGIARTSFGLRQNQITYVQDFDVENRLRKLRPEQVQQLLLALEHPRSPPYTPHLRRGAALGCCMTSAFSWSCYCAACEAASAAWQEEGHHAWQR